MISTIEVENDLKEIFAHLHEHPETSWNEVQTTKYIIDLLEKEGCRVTSFSDCTGLFADIGTGKPVVAIRADMDALWQEVDGVFRANHSCGHDAHMTMVIGAIRLLLASKFNGTVRFIFQPAEEKGNGALKMVEKGAIYDVDYLFGIHLRPIQELNTGVVIMRERTPFTASLFKKLPKLKLLITSGMRNASIDLPAATKHGVAVCGTASMSEPPTELT